VVGLLARESTLVERCGGSVAAVAVLIELGFLSGRDKLGGAALTSLLTV